MMMVDDDDDDDDDNGYGNGNDDSDGDDGDDDNNLNNHLPSKREWVARQRLHFAPDPRVSFPVWVFQRFDKIISFPLTSLSFAIFEQKLIFIVKRVAVAWSETNKGEGKKANKGWSKQTGSWVISQVHVVYDHSEFSSKKKILYFAICSLSDLSSLGSSLWSNDQNM